MKAFEERLRSHYDELSTLYASIYGDDGDSFSYFLAMLERSYGERADALRELDARRGLDPGWSRSNKLLGMMLYVSCFAGDLKGVGEKLPYLQECGVNYLHLMPLLASPKGRSDGGYAVSDFRSVQPELGSMEDLEALAADCRERGILLCLDFVLNHTSEEHPWARAAREGDPTARSRYFFYDSWDEPNVYEQTVPQVFPTTAPGSFTYLPDCGKIVMTSFYPFQWDLNYRNPMVFNDMAENLLYLANRGMDVIRLDAIPYIWKQPGTSCRNLPQVHTLTRMLQLACRIVCPGVLLLGEVVMEPARVAPYFGSPEKPECDMLYNSTTMCTVWNTVATRDVGLLRHQMSQVCALPENCLFLNYLRCHDDIGWGLDYDWLGYFGQMEVPHKKYLNDYFTGNYPGSPSRGELYNDDPSLGDARLCGTTASLCGVESALFAGGGAALERALSLDIMLHALMLSLSGIPVLYSGDEVAQFNDYSYHEDPEKADDSRYIHRGAFDWERAGLRADPTSVQGRVFHALRELEAVRSLEPVFHSDAQVSVPDAGSGHVLLLCRCYGGERLAAAFNFSEQPQRAALPGGEYVDLLSGASAGGGEREIPGYGFLWLKGRDE